MTRAAEPKRLELVRRAGVLVETVHALVYFAPEPQDNYAALGLRGYWRGYFASRAAPLGEVGPALVTALFGGFAPAMVAMALPEVWTFAAPARVRVARLTGAHAALSRVLIEAADTRGGTPGRSGELDALLGLTGACVQALPMAGRPMAAAQAGLGRPAEPLAALWHDCTVLREFRGDAHLDAVAVSGLVWPEPHLIKGDLVSRRQQEFRSWDDATWQSAAARVRGQDQRELDVLTDQLAAMAFNPLDDAELRHVIRGLVPVAGPVAAHLPYPNAMGVPAP